MGAYVHLQEYNNIEGMILLSELSRRRIRSIQKLIRVGRSEVVVVLRVDKEKGEARSSSFHFFPLPGSNPYCVFFLSQDTLISPSVVCLLRKFRSVKRSSTSPRLYDFSSRFFVCLFSL